MDGHITINAIDDRIIDIMNIIIHDVYGQNTASKQVK